MPKAYLKWGDYNAYCDICGRKHKASELKENWKHEKVCNDCWEPRHPQELLRVPKDDPHVPWARPGGELETGPACWIWDQSAYADLGTADCMKADYTPVPYEVMLALKWPGYPLFPYAIPNLAIPGIAIPGFGDYY